MKRLYGLAQHDQRVGRVGFHQLLSRPYPSERVRAPSLQPSLWMMSGATRSTSSGRLATRARPTGIGAPYQPREAACCRAGEAMPQAEHLDLTSLTGTPECFCLIRLSRREVREKPRLQKKHGGDRRRLISACAIGSRLRTRLPRKIGPPTKSIAV